MNNVASTTQDVNDWTELNKCNSLTRRECVQVYARFGLHPVVINGLHNGKCTCGHDDCSKPGKHPVQKGWADAPLDLAEIDSLLARNASFNIGLRMGHQPDGSILVALDCDDADATEMCRRISTLEAKLGALPDTLVARSGRGFHWIFDGVTTLTFQATALDLPMVSIERQKGES